MCHDVLWCAVLCCVAPRSVVLWYAALRCAVLCIYSVVLCCVALPGNRADLMIMTHPGFWAGPRKGELLPLGKPEPLAIVFFSIPVLRTRRIGYVLSL